MLAHFRLLLVFRVQPPAHTPDRYHFLLVSNLINVGIARGSDYAHLVGFYIKNEVVLTHKGAAHQNFVRSRKFLQRHAILIFFVSKEVLTWVPFKLRGLSIDHGYVEIQYGETHKVAFGTLLELVLIICEADRVLVIVTNALAFAVICRV